jgi:hypothetical protein
VEDPAAPPVQDVEPPRTAPPPPTLAARASALAEVVLTSGFPTQLALGLLLVAAGLDLRTPDGRLSLTYVVTLWLLDAVVLVGLITALVRLRGDRVSVLLLGNRSWRREARLGLWLVPVVFGAVIGALVTVRLLWPDLHNVAINPFEDLIRSPRDAAILASVAVLSGGIKEEFQRAFVLRRFEQHLGGAWVAWPSVRGTLSRDGTRAS